MAVRGLSYNPGGPRDPARQGYCGCQLKSCPFVRFFSAANRRLPPPRGLVVRFFAAPPASCPVFLLPPFCSGTFSRGKWAARFFYGQWAGMARLAAFFWGSGLVRPVWRRFSMPAGIPPLLSAFSSREITKTRTNTPKNPHRPDSANKAKSARPPPRYIKTDGGVLLSLFFGCRRPQPKMRTNTKSRTSFC